MLRLYSSISSSHNYHSVLIRNGSSIPIILLENIPNWGDKGEIVKVKRGFARNYLIPQKKAVYATDDNKENILRLRETPIAGHSQAETVIKLPTRKIIIQKSNVGPNGVLYGSVTAADICEELKMNHNFSIDVQKINLGSISVIKSIGEFVVDINGEKLTVIVDTIPSK